jgi:CubicO group peptidase (beta-lactamase class C family)
VDSSWVPRTTSSFSGQAYGYGWWLRDARTPRGTARVRYAWGYGGQLVFVVPELALVVVATSDPDAPTRDQAHLAAVHALLDESILPAVAR